MLDAGCAYGAYVSPASRTAARAGSGKLRNPRWVCWRKRRGVRAGASARASSCTDFRWASGWGDPSNVRGSSAMQAAQFKWGGGLSGFGESGLPIHCGRASALALPAGDSHQPPSG